MYMMNDREFSNRKETLHGEFYENALKYPERIALIYENEKVSYKMLRLYALRAANYMWQRVKIRGHRIELGEIESVLKSISRIKEAVVVAQGDKYHKELVAFYLGEYIAESEIEDYLKIHLPEYSIPNSINRLENFPLNANGKVDRRRLAEYQKTDSVEIMSDKVLNIVLMIWEELLKNKVADLDENLFKIGADSLLAARFVAAINARCGIEVRMKEVFMNPSINALTKLVDKRKNTDIAEFVEEGEI